MAVHLRTSDQIPDALAALTWIPIAGCHAQAPAGRQLPDLARRLEQAFGVSREDWWSLARTLQVAPSSRLSYAVSCNPGPSDLGTMLAWSALVRDAAGTGTDVLAVCDDPWLFRHLADQSGVVAGRPPALLARRLGLALRGYAARLSYMLVALRERLATRAQKRAMAAANAPALVVYGHPASSADGRDAYFADLMARIPGLKRLLHTDSTGAHRARLTRAGATASLHAWGTFGALAGLVLAKWRPAAADLAGPYSWLVRRAADLEGARAGAAAMAWQQCCLDNWIAEAAPAVVAWPWESHAWERQLVRALRAPGAKSVGYQHSVVGRHMYNLSPAALPDGDAGLPDCIVAAGPAFAADMLALGVPAARVRIGGALRFEDAPNTRMAFDPSGPVFVALPSASAVAAELLDAVAAVAARQAERDFIIKEHPMYRFQFAETGNLKRVGGAVAAPKAMSAAIYAASTVGLETALAGIPTIRFVPAASIAMDILPGAIELASTDSAGLEAALLAARPPATPDLEAVFPAPDWAMWAMLMAGAERPGGQPS